MKIDEQLVERIAALARLRFSEEERADFTRQFADIVTFVERLSEVDVSGVEESDQRGDNVIEPDEVRPGFSRDDAMANAPAHDGEFFLVPKVIGDERE